MVTSILFLIIGLKLNILTGWYLSLLIIKIIFDTIGILAKAYKLGKENE